MNQSMRVDSPFKTQIQSNPSFPRFEGQAPQTLPPTAGPTAGPQGGSFASSGPFATHGPCASGPFATRDASFRTVVPDQPNPNLGMPPLHSQSPSPMQSQKSPMHSQGPGLQGSQGMGQPMNSMPPMNSMGPSGMNSLGMASMPGPFTSNVPDADVALGRQCLLVVTKLLDVPVESGLFGGGAKTYQLRVLDHGGKELARSEEIQGLEDSELGEMPAQTFAIPDDLGALKAKTLSKTVHVEVEFAGVISGTTIGSCQINRLDLRSNKPWPYEVTKNGKVVCGIELCIVEDEPLGDFNSMGVDDMSSQTGALGALQSFLTDKELEDVHHGVSCMMELHGAKDLPKPRSPEMKDVVVSILTDTGKELRKIGLFQSQEQIGRQLASVDLQQTKTFVQAPLHFGGDAQEGSQYIKVMVSYGRRAGQNTVTEQIGITDPIKVSWKPVVKDYQAIRNPGNRNLLGGIYLSHRLVTEAESVGQQDDGDVIKTGRRAPELGPPVAVEHRVSGRTGNFPEGSQEEAFEQAVINAEAQNRALLQRCKKEDISSSHDYPGMRLVNGWREWESLDALFDSMGPSPMVMSEELGPQVSRGYQHASSVARDVAKHLPAARSQADQYLNLEMVKMYHKDDVAKQHSMIRPVVCKDPVEIATPADMTWCPDPPVYVPVSNLTEQDKETSRLACYKPEQNAALLFVDANPNYNIREDIWGALQEEKTGYRHLQNFNRSQHRVKDDCLMA